jgi:hypothetical protein
MDFRWLVPSPEDRPTVKAIVVFHDEGSAAHPISRFLKVGFRHVFAAVQVGNYWVSLDGEAGVPVVKVLAAADYDLATLYRSHGMTVVETEQRKQPLRAPFISYNCVGLVKALLCIRSLAITPHQLYRHLLKEIV